MWVSSLICAAIGVLKVLRNRREASGMVTFDCGVHEIEANKFINKRLYEFLRLLYFDSTYLKTKTYYIAC